MTSSRESDLIRKIARISQSFMQLETSSLDERLSEGLHAIAESFGADRAYFQHYPSRGGGCERTYAWCARGLELPPLTEVVDAGESLRFIGDAFRRGETMVAASLSDLRGEERRIIPLAQSRHVRSLMLVPVRTEAGGIGLLVLESVRREKHWRAEETHPLRMAAEVFAAAISRQQAEQALVASEARFRALAEHAPELIAEIGPSGRYRYVSPSFRDLLGYAPGALVDTLSADLLHPDDLDESRGRFEQAIASEGSSESEHRLRHADGSWRWFANTGRTYRGAAGELCFVSIGRDITKRRELEEVLRQNQVQLLQSQKMEALGRLAGGIAHDFNNLLMIIMGNAERARAAIGSPETQREVADILDAVERAAELTRQLLAFGRPEAAESSHVDVNDAVARLEPVLRRLLGEDTRMEIDVAPVRCGVDGQLSQLEQILMNLTLNARDAMPQGGRLVLSTRVSRPEPEVAQRLGLGAGPHVVLCVADSGVGMSEGVTARIFEPFFTTKDTTKGTGLGLSVVYGIVQRLGGAIEVDTQPGAGATFRIWLPRHEPEHDPKNPGIPIAVPGGHETVLAVEDEPGTRRLLKLMLEDAGYRVLLANDGADALEQAEAWPERIDLLVSDVVMPRMRGVELAEHLRARRPELRVLFVSGYSDDEQRRSVAGAEFLAKPFSQDQLRERVRKLLDGATARPSAG